MTKPGPEQQETNRVTLRPNTRQLLGTALVRGVLGGIGMAVGATLLEGLVGAGWTTAYLLPSLVGVPLGLGAGLLVFGRVGVKVDDAGVQPGFASGGTAPWSTIADIRVERRRGRRIVALRLKSGKVWRLRAPYDGPRLAHDPEFDDKVGVLLRRWKQYRHRKDAPARKP